MVELEQLVPPSESTRSSGLASERAICLFAFAESVTAPQRDLPDVTFERELFLHCVGSIVALVGVVPIADYCGADSERHLTDIAWLAPRVRRHAELVEWATHWSSIFPAPFGTFYSSLDSLTTFMRAHEATIGTFLRSVADKEEWELKAAAQFDDPDALDQMACSLWLDWRNLSKGARYMRLCRDKSAVLDFGRTQAAALVDDFIVELQPFAKDARLLGLSSCAPDSAGRSPVARYALLVTKADVAALKARVREIASRASHRHIMITLSGPWPPFSFRPNLG